MTARHRLLLVVMLAVAFVAPAGASPARAAAYDRFYANFGGEELMRAINGDRQALGLAALATDATLESLARERPIVCPSNPSLVILGRSRDMAERNYLSHTIPGCTDSGGAPFDAFDLLVTFGYHYGAVAENLASNNYPGSTASYGLGCGLSGTGCHGSTSLPWSVAVAERGFMSSSGHRANILSKAYDRFGCASWSSTSGNHYYACFFASHGSGVLDSGAPSIVGMSGVGATFARGSRPSFTATARDAISELSDGWADIDGVRIRSWAWDHVGATASLTATPPALKAGHHTFTWWVRDTSTRSRAVHFSFSVP